VTSIPSIIQSELEKIAPLIGFKPQEIALFLGFDEAKKKNKTFQVVVQGEKTTRTLDLASFERHFHIHYLAHPKFQTIRLFQNVLTHCPWAFHHTNLGEQAQTCYTQFKSKIEQGLIPKVSIRWIDSNKGYGLFAEETFQEGAFLGEYTGMFHKLSRLLKKQSPYAFQYPKFVWPLIPFAIDAYLQGNETRFMNHSDTPNVLPLPALDRNLIHVIFCAKRPITKGEELSFHYGKDYWRLLKEAH